MASLRKFFSDIFNQWLEDEPFSLAAALSYYTLFSLAPDRARQPTCVLLTPGHFNSA